MKYLLNFLFLFIIGSSYAQPTIYPAPANEGYILIKNGRIHVGNGTIIDNGSILIKNKKIAKVGTDITAPDNAIIYDVEGQEVYPGLINPITNLGIKEVDNYVNGSNDYKELGDLNPGLRSIVAYNTDSRNINVLRSTGILLANVVPQPAGGSRQIISGTSSVVQLDAWTWKDAAYKMDGQMHINIPNIISTWRWIHNSESKNKAKRKKKALKRIERVKHFFRQAEAYMKNPAPEHTNLKLEATRGLFDGSQKLFAHADAVREMLLAIDLKKEFGFNIVIVGGRDSWKIAPLLKKHNIPVILEQLHRLPATYDDNIDQPFKTPSILQDAGVLFCIADHDGTTRGRNLKYNAGTAVAYGLTKEQALSAITLNTARILGIADRTGSIEVGKDANIIVSKGDVLDMATSIITLAFIQGRKINLENKQTQLAERYRHRYGIK